MKYVYAIAVAAAVSCAANAVAEQKGATPTTRSPYILPPIQYDYPYQGKLTIERVQTVAELQAACNIGTKWALGCAFKSTLDCRIILVPDHLIRKWGWTPEQMMRHEMGHCNGWPGDHPGTRPYWAKAGNPPPKSEPRHGLDSGAEVPPAAVVDTRTGIPEIHCPSGQVTEPCK